MQQTTLKFFNEQSVDNSGLSVYTPLSLLQRDNIKLHELPGLRTDENYMIYSRTSHSLKSKGSIFNDFMGVERRSIRRKNYDYKHRKKGLYSSRQ